MHSRRNHSYMRSRVLIVVVILGCTLLPGAAFGQSLQEKAWSILNAGVQEKTIDKRAKAVRALGLLTKDPKAATLAQAALSDPQPDVRVAAASALGQMEASSAIPALRSALEDKDGAVVMAAADALAKLKDSSAYQVYYAVLTGRRKTGHGLFVDQAKVLRDRKRLAELALEQGLGFVPFAGMGYSAIKAASQDTVSPVRAEAARSLIQDPDPDTTAALLEAVGDKSWIVRAAALNALARRNLPIPLAQVGAAMYDTKDTVQYTAAATVVHLSELEPPAPPAPAKPENPKTPEKKMPAKKASPQKAKPAAPKSPSTGKPPQS
jgi:HEAT repeat protein